MSRRGRIHDGAVVVVLVGVAFGVPYFALPEAPASASLERPATLPDTAAAGTGGTASWYAAEGRIAAAGPELRAWLGRGWRGELVRVTAGGRSVVVRLTDWCQCYRGERRERLIDLSDDAFAELAPLPAGLIQVRIEPADGRPTSTPPATDR